MTQPQEASRHVQAVIRKCDDAPSKWCLYAKDGGKRLGGPYDEKSEAEERERQVQFFKHEGAIRARERNAPWLEHILMKDPLTWTDADRAELEGVYSAEINAAHIVSWIGGEGVVKAKCKNLDEAWDFLWAEYKKRSQPLFIFEALYEPVGEDIMGWCANRFEESARQEARQYDWLEPGRGTDLVSQHLSDLSPEAQENAAEILDLYFRGLTTLEETQPALEQIAKSAGQTLDSPGFSAIFNVIGKLGEAITTDDLPSLTEPRADVTKPPELMPQPDAQPAGPFICTCSECSVQIESPETPCNQLTCPKCQAPMVEDAASQRTRATEQKVSLEDWARNAGIDQNELPAFIHKLGIIYTELPTPNMASPEWWDDMWEVYTARQTGQYIPIFYTSKRTRAADGQIAASEYLSQLEQWQDAETTASFYNWLKKHEQVQAADDAKPKQEWDQLWAEFSEKELYAASVAREAMDATGIIRIWRSGGRYVIWCEDEFGDEWAEREFESGDERAAWDYVMNLEDQGNELAKDDNTPANYDLITGQAAMWGASHRQTREQTTEQELIFAHNGYTVEVKYAASTGTWYALVAKSTDLDNAIPLAWDDLEPGPTIEKVKQAIDSGTIQAVLMAYQGPRSKMQRIHKRTKESTRPIGFYRGRTVIVRHERRWKPARIVRSKEGGRIIVRLLRSRRVCEASPCAIRRGRSSILSTPRKRQSVFMMLEGQWRPARIAHLFARRGKRIAVRCGRRLFAVESWRLRPLRAVEIGDRVQFKMPTFQWATGIVVDFDDLFGVPKLIVKGPDGKEYEAFEDEIREANQIRAQSFSMGPQRRNGSKFAVGDWVTFKSDYEGSGEILKVLNWGYMIGPGRETGERWHSQAYWNDEFNTMVVSVDFDHVWPE